jgi:hypothetical protein
MSEFSSDREFYGTYLNARETLVKAGWREGSTKKTKTNISTLFHKDGYAIFVLYGCEEDIKNEIL